MTFPIEILKDDFLRGIRFLEGIDDTSIREQKLINKEQLINSANSVFEIEGDCIRGIMYRDAHGIYQNYGVKRSSFNIGYKKWIEVTKEWAQIVKPGLSDEDIKDFQSAIYFKKKSLSPGEFALKPREWIKKGTDLANSSFDSIFDINKTLEVLFDESFRILEEAA